MSMTTISDSALSQWSDARWRLDNLYYITNEDGDIIPFRMNWAQENLWDNGHYLNLVLKARQIGFTTFIQLVMLDACLFTENIRCGTIAHNLDDVRVIFRDKVKFPYDNLPDGLKEIVGARQDSAQELLFSNNSSIRVGTSMRSGTLQFLHVSEYGKICAKYPDKAKEIRTGALNTLQAGQVAWIESTAQGQEGDFFDKCEAARSAERLGEKLTPLDFKFHFFPWWGAPKYEMDPDGIVFPEADVKYFERLSVEHGIELTERQKAWYAKKAKQQGDDMKREYPSTPEEAFEASIEGAYYSREIAQAEKDGRIRSVPYEAGLPVYTVWDLGMSDNMSIWWFQIAPDGLRIIDYYENHGEAIPHYADVLFAKPYAYATRDNCFVPHDAKVRELGTGKTRIETMLACGLKPRLVPDHYVHDGIQAARGVFKHCWFDKTKTAQGLKALRSYRKDWDEKFGTWKSGPRHDWASHAADAFRYLAMAYKELEPEPEPKKPKPINTAPPTFDQLQKWSDEEDGRRRPRL